MLFLTIIFSVLAILHARDGEDKMSSRIWYGTNASITDYPFSAALFYDGELSCGAVILSDRWLATSGICYVPDYLNLTAEAVVGADQLADGQHYVIDLEIQHPNFTRVILDEENEFFYLNDITLLRLNKSLTFSDKVKPLQLPQHDYEVDVLHSSAGFGEDENLNLPDHLLEVKTLRTYNISEYFSIFKNQTSIEQYKEVMSRVLICMKRDDIAQSMCAGDVGNAVVHDNHLVGLVSYGDKWSSCKELEHLMLSNVFSFVDWIKSQTGIK